MRAGYVSLLRRSTIGGVRGIVLIALSSAVCGCTTRISPPIDVASPARVYLVDYGYHSSIVLPDADGRGREFAYGEWGWFAKNHDGILDAFRLVLLPNQGTLGIRDYPAPLSAAMIASRTDFEQLHEITVDRCAALTLRRLLDESVESALRHDGDYVYNPVVDLYFVRNPAIYWCGHNCNHQTATWLETLHCRVSGPRTFADFDVVGNGEDLSGRSDTSTPANNALSPG